MRTLPTLFVAMLALCMLSAPSYAETIYLRAPAYEDGKHAYFHELITRALEATGHTPYIRRISDFPHLREHDMLKNGGLDVLWLIRSDERDATYLPIPVPLTNGLIGQRILLVNQHQKEEYKDVSTLAEFRRLGKVGGFGKDWFDVGVWDANHLPYLEMADWKLIYRMLEDGNRGVDYFSRGFTEILQELRANPFLGIEPNLMFVYDRDYILYVSPTRSDLAPLLTEALTKASQSGLMNRLIHKHWAKSFTILKPESRTVIRLKAPH